MSRNILIMTATITPLPGIPALVRTDPKQRLEDYRTSLAFYMEHLGRCFDQIIFVENSSSDISSLIAFAAKNRHSDKVQFISFFGLDFPPAYGRGYGEYKLIDYAMANSEGLNSDDLFWKVTGRYIVKNIHEIVASYPSNTDLYCNFRNYPFRLCDLYLLGWTLKGYEACINGVYLKLRNDSIKGTHTMEEILFRNIVERADPSIHIVPRFNVVPIIRGVRGWNNSQYSADWGLKILLRRLALFFIPKLWI